MSRETKANVNNKLTVGRTQVQTNVEYLSLKESRKHNKRQREEKRAQRNTCQSKKKNHLSLGQIQFKIGTCISSGKGTQWAQHVAYGALRKENTDVIFLRDTKRNMKKEIDCSQRTILEAFRLLIA